MSEAHQTETLSFPDQTAEASVAYTTHPTTGLDETVAELREIIRQIVRQEQRPAAELDENGELVFKNEAAYVAYLNAHPDKYPGELRAYFIDPHGPSSL